MNESGLHKVVFTADGRHLIASAGGAPVVWSLPAFARTEVPAQFGSMTYLDSDAEGRRFGFADEMGVLVWDSERKQTSRVELPPGFYPDSLGALSADGRTIALRECERQP